MSRQANQLIIDSDADFGLDYFIQRKAQTANTALPKAGLNGFYWAMDCGSNVSKN